MTTPCGTPAILRIFIWREATLAFANPFLSEIYSVRVDQKSAPRNTPIYLNNHEAKMIRVDIALAI
jgi:hypothetical protein